MALTNSILFFILITNVLCNEDRRLLVGPIPNQETGRYIFKKQTSSKSLEAYKHCLYCDTKVAFYNTSMNLKHQEPNCINKYSPDKINDELTEYERTHKLVPICKLGVVPGCGPPPDEKLIQYCDPGYSNVNYSVYFSCLVANDETRTLLSIYYCNENLKWEFIREYKNDVVTDKTSTLVVIEEETVVTVTMGRKRTTSAETTLIYYEQSMTDTSVGTTGNFTTLYTVVVILACVLSLITLGLGALLGRYLYKRNKRILSGFFNVISTSSSFDSPSSVCSHSNECQGEEVSSLIESIQSCWAHVKGENAKIPYGLDTVESQREQPVGQEPLLFKVSLQSEKFTKKVPDEEKLNCRPYHSCPDGQRRGYGDNEPGYNQAHNIQNEDRDSNEISRTGHQRLEPIGEASTPRHEDRLEENSEITEPKRVLSYERMNRLGIENDASFEIGPADSGINMNAEAESYQIQNLKEK